MYANAIIFFEKTNMGWTRCAGSQATQSRSRMVSLV